MDDNRELHRFRKGGERCSRCRAKRWYSENGLRFCQNGHQIEGVVEFAAEDDGLLGLNNHHTVRKEKEARVVEKKRLKGPKGRDLYLECLQYLLRSQALWLIREKRCQPELEEIVRDLWDLRTRGCPPAEENEKTQTEEVFFSSSQPLPADDAFEVDHAHRPELNWKPSALGKWSAPSMMETLSINYLGCLMLRIPIQIGDIFNWAKAGELPYVNAMEIIPEGLTERLPQPYPQMLKSPSRTPIKGNDLYATVTDMKLAYHINYGMEVPPINYYPMAMDLVKILALPVETMIIMKHVASALRLTFELPVAKSRIMLIDRPEIQLIALIMTITKHFFPFPGPSGIQHRPALLPTVNWEKWSQYIKTQDAPKAEVKDYSNVTGKDLVTMTDTEQEEFLQQIMALSKPDDPNNTVLSFFPFDKERRAPSFPKKNTNYSPEPFAVQYPDGISYQNEPSTTPTSYHSISDRKLDDLSTHARQFYETVSARTGLSIDIIILAVDNMETKIQREERGQ